MVMDSDEALVDQIAADKSITAEDIDEMDLSSGLDEKEGEDRKGKYLLYWLTTTSIFTTTAYTATWTLGSLHCTPSGFVELTSCASLG